jgi:hypothetical protein
MKLSLASRPAPLGLRLEGVLLHHSGDREELLERLVDVTDGGQSELDHARSSHELLLEVPDLDSDLPELRPDILITESRAGWSLPSPWRCWLVLRVKEGASGRGMLLTWGSAAHHHCSPDRTGTRRKFLLLSSTQRRRANAQG